MNKTVIGFFIVCLITGCSAFSERFPDRSREYESAESLPDLEIPPDLTAGSINNRMSIPGEDRRPESAPVQRVPPAQTAPVQTAATLPSTDSQPAPSGDTEIAVVESINNKPLLSIPEEYTRAWVNVERILKDAGIEINEQDRTTGIFNVSYSPDSGPGQRSLMTMIKTWSFSTTSSKDYQLSLTGVGNKTELVVLDMEGEWAAGDDTNNLIATIRDHYNLSRTQ